MATELGAGVRDLPYVKGTYGIYHEPHPGEDGTGILAVYKGAIAVDRAGRRFVDESRPYKALGDASLAQEGARTWQVFDATVMAASSYEVPIYYFSGRERAGMMHSAVGRSILTTAFWAISSAYRRRLPRSVSA